MEIQPQATVTLRLTGPQLEAEPPSCSPKIYCWTISSRRTSRIWFARTDGERQRRHLSVQGVLPGFHSLRKILGDALALVNGDLSGERTANVELALFSGDGNPLGPKKPITLGPLSHTAKFLHEHFPGQTLDGGKVEIASDSPIFGTALTFSGGQFSSLPLEPAPVTYSVRLVPEQGSTATGELSLPCGPMAFSSAATC